jgi:hypothetical protein
MSSPVLNIIVKLPNFGGSSSLILYSNGRSKGLALEEKTETFSEMHLKSVMFRSADNGTPFPLFKLVRSFSFPFVIIYFKSSF